MSNTIVELREKHGELLGKIAKMQKQADSILDTILYLEEDEKPEQGTLALTSRPGRPRKRAGKPSPLLKQIEQAIRAHDGIMHRRDILHAVDPNGRRFKGDTESKRVQRLGTYLTTHRDLFEPASTPGDGRWKLAGATKPYYANVNSEVHPANQRIL